MPTAANDDGDRVDENPSGAPRGYDPNFDYGKPCGPSELQPDERKDMERFGWLPETPDPDDTGEDILDGSVSPI